MRISDEKIREIVSDLSLDKACSKGVDLPVRNCWHFCSDGNAVDVLFIDDDDYINAMNRICVVMTRYDVVILAFVIMSTHIHFILYGCFDECNRFVHEYLRCTSIEISRRYGERHKLRGVRISHQMIGTDRYLKTAICYVLKNPVSAGMHYMPYNYPWSSGALMFNGGGYWSSLQWKTGSEHGSVSLEEIGSAEKRSLLKTHNIYRPKGNLIGNLVFPGDYVAFEVAEKIFRTPRSFNYFMSVSKDTDVESKGGSISYLSLPVAELRQRRNELCSATFGTESIRSLDTAGRLILARKLKSLYNSSPKQIIRICGLKYSEASNLL